jgi:hypothetical protein
MMNHTDGWMSGWMVGGIWIWTVIGVLLVALPDVDNTLLDNDRFAADSGAHLQQAFGAAKHERFFSVQRVVAQTERDLDAAARVGSARQATR